MLTLTVAGNGGPSQQGSSQDHLIQQEHFRKELEIPVAGTVVRRPSSEV